MDSSPTKVRSVNKLSDLKLQLTICGLQRDLLNNCDNEATSLLLINYDVFNQLFGILFLTHCDLDRKIQSEN